MSDSQVKVVFTPSGRRGSFPVGTPLLHAARELGVDIDSVCGGRGLCGRCQILCAEGEFPKHEIASSAESLSSFTETEKHFSERKRPLAPGRRLSCHTLLLADAVIDVPPDSQVHRQVVRKDAEHRDISLDASVRLYSVEVTEADMHHPKGDVQRLLQALENEWSLTELEFDHGLLGTLQGLLRDGQWFVTVAVAAGSRVTAVWPGFHDAIYGVAVDIGSTTIAVHLCDLVNGDVVGGASMMNPQIRFGEDLMSRVSYVMMHPEGADEMTDVIREAVNALIGEVCEQANVSRDLIMEIAMVANPIMHHIFLGISPVELGGAPFALATDSALSLPATKVGLDVNDGGMIYILPCIAGHVGADTAGMILSEEPQLQEEMTLLVDVGTNAEIVLGNCDRLVACSSPTGPAFEGAQISCGQRAAAGAIERVRIDPQTLEPRFKVIGSDIWSDEHGFDAVAVKLGISGICGSGIIEVIAEMYLAGIITSDGVIDGAMASVNSRIVPDGRTWAYQLWVGDAIISVSQNDVRQIQLAKAALYAGVKLLMDRLGLDTVDRIRLAGAFGSNIDVKYAMVLGLIPDCDLDKVSSAGNAAGTGARIALLNNQARQVVETVVRDIEKIETAVEARFQDYFVDAMAFPNKTDEFPNLFSEVTRPAEKVLVGAAETGGRKRRRRG